MELGGSDASVGSCDGTSEGGLDGTGLGCALGCALGTGLGSSLGIELGGELGASVGTRVPVVTSNLIASLSLQLEPEAALVPFTDRPAQYML